jgi:Leucine-rich repeat (LRR) protein
LDSLETLSLQDNNILLVPASALGRLPRLTTLQLDFNRVAALGSDILRAVADRVTSLSLARNVVRELPSDAFQVFIIKLNFQKIPFYVWCQSVNTIFFFTGLQKTTISGSEWKPST